MDHGLISVIVPIYNGEHYVAECVKTLQNQSYNNLEIILIDDGSTDMTYQKCCEMQEKDKRIKTIHSENFGQGHARNIGINLAKGEYIGFCDVDDKMDSEMYKTLYDLISKYNADFAGVDHSSMSNGTVTYKRGGKKPDKTVHVTNRKETIAVFSTGKKIAWGVWDKLFRKESLNKIRFPEEKIHAEDTLFLLEFIKKNDIFCWTEQGMYWHNDTNNDSYTKRQWSRSNLGLTKFYLELNTTVSAIGLNSESDLTMIRCCENLLSTYIRCVHRSYTSEAEFVREEMFRYKAKMLKSRLKWYYKFDYLLCLYFPHFGPVINFIYK